MLLFLKPGHIQVRSNYLGRSKNFGDRIADYLYARRAGLHNVLTMALLPLP